MYRSAVRGGLASKHLILAEKQKNWSQFRRCIDRYPHGQVSQRRLQKFPFSVINKRAPLTPSRLLRETSSASPPVHSAPPSLVMLIRSLR